MSEVTRDVFAGTIGGLLQAIVGHPLDLVKTRVQQTSSSISTTEVMSQIIRSEGPTAFYKGIQSPIIFCAVMNGCLFSINSFSKTIVSDFVGVNRKLSPTKHGILSAWLTSPMYCLIVTPVEVIKVRLAIQKESMNSGKAKYSSTLDCIKQLGVKEGVQGYFRGYLSVTGMRLVGLPFYFVTYDLCKRTLDNFVTNQLQKQPGGSEQQKFLWPSAVAGGVAGVMFWTCNFPLDSMKTVIQATDKPMSLSDAFQTIYARGGRSFGSFYHGLVPCLLRAVPANAAAFFGLEYGREIWTRNLSNNGMSHGT